VGSTDVTLNSSGIVPPRDGFFREHGWTGRDGLSFAVEFWVFWRDDCRFFAIEPLSAGLGRDVVVSESEEPPSETWTPGFSKPLGVRGLQLLHLNLA